MYAYTWTGRLIAVGVGSLFAGLFMGSRELLPYLAARRTGVITRRGHNAVKVYRHEDEARFNHLLANRRKGATLGFGLSAAGAAALTLGVALFLLELRQ